MYSCCKLKSFVSQFNSIQNKNLIIIDYNVSFPELLLHALIIL